MGSGIGMAPPPIRRADGSEIEPPGNDRTWWDEVLASSHEAGLADLQLFATTSAEVRFRGAIGTHEGRSVSLRPPRLLEGRAGDDVINEPTVSVEARALDPALGTWVMESPAKWFRGRRAWALNRPPFTTGDASFDACAASWAWGCSITPAALQAALNPLLPTIRTNLEAQPGAIVTGSGISTWVPFEDAPRRLPLLLFAAAGPAAHSTHTACVSDLASRQLPRAPGLPAPVSEGDTPGSGVRSRGRRRGLPLLRPGQPSGRS